MKAVLLSIRPKWVQLIVNGEKTLEIRKRAPGLTVPFKCYIYCSMANTSDPNSVLELHPDGYANGRIRRLNGKVAAEFICDKMFPVWPGYAGQDGNDCLTYEEMEDYLGYRGGWALHISDLVVYDEPKELSALKDMDGKPVHTAPQSWRYVQEEK